VQKLARTIVTLKMDLGEHPPAIEPALEPE